MKIRNRWITEPIFDAPDARTMHEAVMLALKAGADLSGADLSGADLSHADLSHANLHEANLRGTDLSRADLSHADLSHADLSHADLSRAKDDFFDVLSSTAHEVALLRQALIDGRINGQVYEGECACLVGTIANIRHCAYNTMPDLYPNSSRPIERLFLSIRPGDTPAMNPISAIVVGWMDEWMTGQASGR